MTLTFDPPKSTKDSPFVVSPNPLDKLGAKHQPTKRTQNFLPYYWMHFRDIRENVKTMVEIGVQTDKSVKMWEEFFPNATIYGIDVSPKCEAFEGDRRRVFIGSQADRDFMENVVKKTGPIDIVVDDGSHKPEHQLFTFSLLFPHLTSHGIYVIEDVDTGNLKRPVSNELKSLVDEIYYWPKGLSGNQWSHLTEFSSEVDWITKNTIGIAFYRWIVFVMRGRNPQDNPYLTKK